MPIYLLFYKNRFMALLMSQSEKHFLYVTENDA